MFKTVNACVQVTSETSIRGQVITLLEINIRPKALTVRP